MDTEEEISSEIDDECTNIENDDSSNNGSTSHPTRRVFTNSLISTLNVDTGEDISSEIDDDSTYNGNDDSSNNGITSCYSNRNARNNYNWLKDAQVHLHSIMVKQVQEYYPEQ